MTRRLVATYLLLAVIVLVALEVPLGVVNQRGQRQDLERRVERDAVALAALSEDVLQAGVGPGNPTLEQVVTSYGGDSGARVVIVGSDGQLLADSDSTRPLGRDFASRPEIADALDGGVSVGTRRSETLGEGLLYVAVPVASGGQVHGAARVTVPTASIDAQVRRYWLLLAAIALVVLVAVAIAGHVLARWVSRPLTHLRNAARQAGRGDLTIRAQTGEGPPEVQELATDFDDMVARLERLVSAQQEFVADASHQLRSPLTALRLRLENLASGGAPAEEVDAAIREVERLSRLVDGLLTLARADQPEAIRAVVDLAAVVSERVEVWSPAAVEADVSLVAEAATETRAKLARGSLEQILDNLIANAVQASPPGGVVTLGAVVRAGATEVTVVDEGPGMSAAERARAFDRFASSRESGGTGLGLAIVRRLVEADGGSVSLEAVEPTGLRVRIAYPSIATGLGESGPRDRVGVDTGAD